MKGSTNVFIQIYDKKQNWRTNGITELIEKEGRYFIEFRKKPFEYNEDKKIFASIKYPEGEQIGFYHQSAGLKKA